MKLFKVVTENTKGLGEFITGKYTVYIVLYSYKTFCLFLVF